MLTGRFDAALAYARAAHSDQTRKGTLVTGRLNPPSGGLPEP
jgi:hypothetical protein